MAGTFHFELVAPEKVLLSESVGEVVLPGSEGYLTVMAGHAPLITRIIPGLVRVRVQSLPERTFVVFGGFADITPEACSLLAEDVVSLEDIDSQDIERRIIRARGEFEAAKLDENRNRAEEFLYHLTTVRSLDTLV